MANISRNLYIKTKDQLYKLIDQNDDLSSNKIFIPFMDSMIDHYYGCRCNESLYNMKSNEEYEILKDNDDVINILKEFFKCDLVSFIN